MNESSANSQFEADLELSYENYYLGMISEIYSIAVISDDIFSTRILGVTSLYKLL